MNKLLLKYFLKSTSRKDRGKEAKRIGRERKGRERYYVDLKCTCIVFPVKEKQSAKLLSSHLRCTCLLFSPPFTSLSCFLGSVFPQTRILPILEFEGHLASHGSPPRFVDSLPEL